MAQKVVSLLIGAMCSTVLVVAYDISDCNYVIFSSNVTTGSSATGYTSVTTETGYPLDYCYGTEVLGFDYGYMFEEDDSCDHVNMTYWDDEYCNGTLLAEINLDISLVYTSLSSGFGNEFSSSGAVSIYPNCGGYDCIIERTENLYTTSDCSGTPFIKTKTAYVDSLCTNIETTSISPDGTTTSISLSTMYTCNTNDVVKFVTSDTDSCSGGTTTTTTLSSQECTSNYEYSNECGVATEDGTGIIIGGSKASEIIVSKWTSLFIVANCLAVLFSE